MWLGSSKLLTDSLLGGRAGCHLHWRDKENTFKSWKSSSSIMLRASSIIWITWFLRSWGVMAEFRVIGCVTFGEMIEEADKAVVIGRGTVRMQEVEWEGFMVTGGVSCFWWNGRLCWIPVVWFCVLFLKTREVKPNQLDEHELRRSEEEWRTAKLLLCYNTITKTISNSNEQPHAWQS